MDTEGIVNYEDIRIYKDRMRIFIILYLFSEAYACLQQPTYRKVFKSEVRIQKIDFLLRNPDYLAYDLLIFAKDGKFDANEIKIIVKEIFKSKEPIIRRLEMERFFFGAYESIDDVIGFLKSIDFIEFSSRRRLDLKKVEKKYFIKEYACNKFENLIREMPSIQWYIRRCELIKKYFGDLSGTELKVLQYQIDEYRNTSYKDYIKDIQSIVRKDFKEIYGEEL